MSWQEIYNSKVISIKEAAQKIESGDRIWISPVSDTPFQLLDEIQNRVSELEDVHINSGLIMKPYPFMKGETKQNIHYHTVFLGPADRPSVSQGNVDIASIAFSQLTNALRDDYKPNTLLATVTPPDEHGYMNFGPNGCLVNRPVADLESCNKVIVQVNSKMPYVYGERNFIHVSQVDFICESDFEPPVLPNAPVDEDYKKIASFIADKIYDGDTLQIGIGNLGNAVAMQLTDKKDLGVHSEMMVDALYHLVDAGAITCERKNFHRGKIIYGFAAGGKELHNFLNKNTFCEAKPFEYVNNLQNIAANDNMVSINSCLQVDLLGQVSSESIGFKQFSATGGQPDFVRGAALSKGGRSFIALKSTAETKGGIISKIVLGHEPGTVITTPRYDVDYLVTEYGMVNLKNKGIEDKAKLIISIAHPDYRDELMFQAKKNGIIW